MWGMWIFLSVLAVVLGGAWIYYMEEHYQKRPKPLRGSAQEELEEMRRDIAALQEQVAEVTLETHALRDANRPPPLAGSEE
ncbi:hypothetical protein HN371_28885 [Candidatus Poribacteria bacterium]|nr:hypothetical protein [Candidatus Poribacteria bacterium]MBT5532566.1 hypothetical protein [Candidatus Poribacteria bacterium]MBT7101825.1 hypothetical protein [Candidatus Poribacteria bacterium]MBT7806197.1 hypothetical protein [Candidatus Poribacteria bacterium]